MSKKHISENGVNLLKRFEGCHLVSYWDVDAYSIGYGHHNSSIKKGEKITQQQADAYLLQDLDKYEKAVDVYDKIYNFTQSQYDALVDFTYNCGAGNLKNLVKSGNRTIKEISNSITAYNKAGGVVLKGLTNRRLAEKELFDKGAVSSSNSQTSSTSNYYPKYTGSETQIDKIFDAIGASKYYDTKQTKAYLKRRPIAQKNGYSGTTYTGTASQNTALIKKAKEGKLVK